VDLLLRERFRFLDFELIRCPAPALACMTLPVAVFLNRFATAFFVLCFGIFFTCSSVPARTPSV